MTDAALSPRGPYLRGLMWLAVLLLPFTGVTGISALGELKGSASVYVLLIAIGIAGLSIRLDDLALPRLVLVLVACLIAWISVVTAVNYGVIASSSMHDRSGISKLVTSGMVVVFGMMVAILASQLFRSVEDVEALFVRPLILSVVVCWLFGIPELLTWVTPAAQGLYEMTTALTRSTDSENGRAIGRLISVSFEAPDLSYWSALMLPWMMYGQRLAWSRAVGTGQRLRAMVPLVLCLTIVAASNSRTGFLMTAGWVVAEATVGLGLRRWRLPAAPLAAVFATCLIGGAVVSAWLTATIGQERVTIDDVSTMTRLSLLISQGEIFLDHPIFGIGLGQFGFHASHYLPGWAWDSYEILNYFEKGPDFPPTFNVYGRIAAELGLPGLIIWFGFWSWTMVRSATAIGADPRPSVPTLLQGAMFSSAACLIIGGISNDQFRRPETWILAGIIGLHAGMRRMAAPAPAPVDRATA